MVLEKIAAMLKSCAGKSTNFPPTLLYNEGWLLRLVLDWFSSHPVPNHPLSFSKDARWYSEALLPSPFLPRRRGDEFAETWTHVDGVIGHFEISDQRKAGIQLRTDADATQFVVLEAKLMSGLSSGVKNAPTFDQAARNVACIAEVLYRAQRPASSMKQLGFYVLAPEGQIGKRIYREQLSWEAISEKIDQRGNRYGAFKVGRPSSWFRSISPSIKIDLLSWEEIIGTIRKWDVVTANELQEFYQQALGFNEKQRGQPPA